MASTRRRIRAAWAHANNTPFPWGKQWPATSVAIAIRWSSRGRPHHARREVRRQFTHCIDVMPTILVDRASRSDRRRRHRAGAHGRLQLRLTFADADAPDRHTVQYFEMYGSRAIYQDGWWACARLDKAPWTLAGTLGRFARGATTRTTTTGSCTPAGRLLAGAQRRRGPPGKTRGAEAAVLAGGRTQSGIAPARRDVVLLRAPAADADDHPIHLHGRRGERASAASLPRMSGRPYA